MPGCSPFEYLIAYAIVFMAGILSMVMLRRHTERIRRSAKHA
jgi:hypothetical protein